MALRKVGSAFNVSSESDGVNGFSGEPSVAGHADGSFLVTWTGPFVPYDETMPSLYTEVYGRTFAYTDVAVGGDTFVVNTEQRDPQHSSHVEARPDGSYVVAYASGTEDQLPGTFIATQIVGANGAKVGPEVFTESYSYYHDNPDIGVFADGSFVTVATDEYDGDGYLHAPNGSITSTFSFGFTGNVGTKAVTSLADGRFFTMWAGYDQDISDFPDDHPPYSVRYEIFNADGSDALRGGIISEIGGDRTIDIDPVAKVLPNGNIVVAWTLDDGDAGKEIFSAIVDLDESERPLVADLTYGKAGDQIAPDIAVLADGRYVVTWEDKSGSALGDESGSAVIGRVFNSDGTFDQNLFRANTATAGSQGDPAVAALGNDFVVTWSGPDGITGQIFDPDALGVPNTYILTRPGLREGAPIEDQRIVGTSGPNSFYFDANANSGVDRIDDSFKANDIVVTNRALADPDGDRLVQENAPYLFTLDGDDEFGFSGAGTDVLRFLGTRTASGGETVYAYADYGVLRPSFVEGTIGRDTLVGTSASEAFFFDTALGIGLGQDQIKNFGIGDRIITTTPIFDDNNDGRIRLNSSDRLLFDTPADDGPSSVKIFNANGRAVSTLLLEQTVTINDDLHFFVYKAAGDPTVSDQYAYS